MNATSRLTPHPALSPLRGEGEGAAASSKPSPEPAACKRTGKIARLPWAIREQLNLCLRNGDSGQELAEWLNSEEEVRMVLVREFGGHSITRQNISEWRQGATGSGSPSRSSAPRWGT
jgi:hypothetical protein